MTRSCGCRAHLTADQHVDYYVKYAERIDTLFGTPAEFSALFSVPTVIMSRRPLA